MAATYRARLAPLSVALLLVLVLLGRAGLVTARADAFAVVVQTLTAFLMAAFLVAGVRRGGPLWRCHLLMLLAMGSGLIASLVRLAEQLGSGASSTAAWEARAVALLWVPLVVGALLSIPTNESRQGFRVRALTDGLLAASSLWYLLLGLGVLDALDASGLAVGHRAQLLASPIGDVFVTATALTVYARSSQAERRMVGWALAGLSVIGCGDVLFAIPENGQLASPGSDAGLISQFGMLLLVLAAASTGRAAPARQRTTRVGLSAAGALPFAPLLGCVALTSRMILDGDGMPQQQLLPALCVALALMGRQLAASRDKERLVQALRARERDLEAEVRRDGLTGLGNRTHLVESLTVALEDPAAWPLSVVLLDLNDFKVINDNHGHETGDAVLREVGRRLRAAVRSEDAVARLGGDEFAIVATQVRDGGEALGARLLVALEPPVLVGAQAFCVRASIGVVNDQEGSSAAAALAYADVAMYEAKEHKGAHSAVAVLSPEARARAARRLRIQEAVSDPQLEQLSLVYQPVVDLGTGRIRGFEALLRWEHPELGTLPPDVFIPLAERAGSISLLGEHALTSALTDLASLQAATSQRLAVGVNVSPAQLVDPGFAADTLRHLRELGLSPDQLNVEITEQAFEADLSAMSAGVRALTSAGVSVAVDDFGTGYSSLQYLQRLPVDVMKIDRSFVWEATESPRAHQLLASIVSLANVLDLQLVAEGIETEEQLRGLQAMGCGIGQGYLFSKPVPFAELRALVLSDVVYPVGRDLVPAPRDALVREWL